MIDEEVGCICEIQTILINMNDDSIAKDVNIMIQKHSDRSKIIVEEIKQCLVIRPTKLETYVSFYGMVINFIDLTPYLLASVFEYINDLDFEKRSPYFVFLRRCINAHIIIFTEIYPYIKKMPLGGDSIIRRACFYNQNALNLCFFAYDIFKIDPNYYNLIENSVLGYAQLVRTSVLFSSFLNKWSEYKDDNFAKLNELSTLGYNRDSIIHPLLCDDVQLLKIYHINPAFSVDQKVEPWVHNPFPLLSSHPTLLMCSAFFGSIRCFKFLLINGADMKLLDNQNLNISTYSMTGGCIDIIRMTEQHFPISENFVEDILVYCHHSVLSWMIENQSLESLEFYNTMLLNSSKHGNIYGIIKSIEKGADVNTRNTNGVFLLFSKLLSIWLLLRTKRTLYVCYILFLVLTSIQKQIMNGLPSFMLLLVD